MKIELNDCTQSFTDDNGTRTVVQGITFAAEGTETIAILGPSGCGKSTILRMVSGMHPRGVEMPTSGSVTINGEPVTGPRDEVMTVWQTPILCRWLSILGNVMLSFKPFLHGPRARYPWEVAQDVLVSLANRIPALRGKIKRSKPYQEIETQAREILREVGLEDAMHKFPGQLSGGMLQRAALAATLVVRPQVLCMDEPFSALDPTTRVGMRQMIKGLKLKYPCLILFITHDVAEALDVADRVLVLSTRPATILEDIRLPPVRGADWGQSAEHREYESQILRTIRQAQGR